MHSLRLAACAVIPADAGIQKPDWMPPDQVRGRLDQVRHDAEYPAACGGVVYSRKKDLLPIANCLESSQRVSE